MTVVVGTAGHIDHGKTTLLRALTGIDADRLPEEKRRGLTIDVGYAHASPDGGPEIDYVDVPGHDRLIGNMLVGVGEIDAALLVVAVDDGPRAQTFEHLGLLHAMGIARGIVALTKADLVSASRVADVGAEVADLLSGTILSGAPIVAVSAVGGAGLDALRAALATARDAIEPLHGRPPGGQPQHASAGAQPQVASAGSWLAIDRAFAVRGRGLVITGTSRGLPFTIGQRVDLLPGDLVARIRGLEVHDAAVPEGPRGGRVALNLTGVERRAVRRGQVLVAAHDPGPFGVATTDRLLVVLEEPAALPGHRPHDAWPPGDGVEARLHIGTDQAGATLNGDARRLADGGAVGLLRLDRPIATMPGARLVLRRPRPAALLAGGTVLDTDPPRGRSRRRQSAARLEALVAAVAAGALEPVSAALLELHGHLRLRGQPAMASDMRAAMESVILEAVAAHHAERPDQAGLPLAAARSVAVVTLRRLLTIDQPAAEQAAASVIADLLDEGRLDRQADSIHQPGRQPSARDPRRDLAMAVLVASLDTAAPPSLAAAALRAGCQPDAVRELERTGRIVVAGDDLAWSAAAFERLRDEALALASGAPLTPAALRDATGTSRKYIMALLEELDRRGVLRRTPAGHVPGPRS